MFEDSIDASPNLNRSVRQKWGLRKSKRRCHRNLTANESSTTTVSEDNFEMPPRQLLSKFLDTDSDEERSHPNNIFKPSNNFERFQTENILAGADRSAPPVPKNNFNDNAKVRNAGTQIFQTCERLLETQRESNTTDYLSCGMEVDDDLNIQTEWLLESFAHQEDAKANLDETVKPETNDNDDDFNVTFLGRATHQARTVPNNGPTKTIVDQILEDFCASLSSSSDDESKSVEFEPFFRFRKKRIRTYERRRFRPLTLVAAATDNRNLNADADYSDTSSELSVQEASTPFMPVVEPLALDASGAVHNNLLNLSAFFTQNLLDVESSIGDVAGDKVWSRRSSVEDDVHMNVDEIEMDNNPSYNLCTEIQTVRLQYQYCAEPVLCTRSGDLLGFASAADIEARKHVAANPLIEVEDTGGNNNAESLTNGDVDMVCNPAPSTSCVVETAVFDEDTWQDDAEFFVNFKTQIVLGMSKSKSEEPPSQNTGTNSKTQRAKSSELSSQTANNDLESQIGVEDLLELFEEPNNKIKKEIKTEAVDEQQQWKCDFNDLLLSEWPLDEDEAENNEAFKIEQIVEAVEGNKNEVQERNKEMVDDIDLNNDLFEGDEIWNEPFTQLLVEKQELTSRVDGQQQDNQGEGQIRISHSIPQIENLVGDHLCQPTTSKQAAAMFGASYNETSKPFMGFTTASAKVIHISDAARKKAEQIFAQLPDFPKANFKAKNKHYDHEAMQFDDETVAVNKTARQLPETPKANESEEDYTNIPLSEWLPSFQSPKKQQTSKAAQQTNDITLKPKFSGFQTAASKPINISKKAIKKYQNFFDEICKEDETNKQQKTAAAAAVCEEDFANIPLSEWLPSYESPNRQNAANPTAHQRFDIKTPTVKSKFAGFHTASSKPINISENAIKKYQNFFDEINKEDILTTLPQPEFNQNQQLTTSVSTSENFANIQRLPSNDSTKASPPKQSQSITTKRKFRSLENTSAHTNEGEQSTKILCRSHTLYDLSKETPKSANLKALASHMPTTATSERTTGLIVRRNLLSLSRQRKSKLRQSLNTNDSNETPIKMVASTAAQQTPNAAEFYAQQPNAASTPQVQAFETPNRRLRSASCLDADFKRINWEQIDDDKAATALTPSRTENSTLNGTLKPLPSPQERIDNLSACGDPPPLPKIVIGTSKRSRCLGLSRRSKTNL